MNIRFHGHACFSIKNSDITIVTSPYSESIGLKLPKLKADVVIVGHDNEAHNNVKGVEGEPMIMNWPGEYETKGVHFKGIHSFHNQKEDKEQLEIDIDKAIIKHGLSQSLYRTKEYLEIFNINFGIKKEKIGP